LCGSDLFFCVKTFLIFNVCLPIFIDFEEGLLGFFSERLPTLWWICNSIYFPFFVKDIFTIFPVRKACKLANNIIWP
jgi:hypothetical protein